MSNSSLDFSNALEEAKELGYAEADPSFDINGMDAAHKISILQKTKGDSEDGTIDIEDGRFTCFRRANDISQIGGFIPAPELGKHPDPVFGTHHARDAHLLFDTMNLKLNLFSSGYK